MPAFPEVPAAYYSQRIAKLVAAGALESQGDIRRMRFSEVRLPSVPISSGDLADMKAKGQFRLLGGLYEEGQGVPRDYVQALNYYRMAADQGDIWSQVAMGRFYENGYGTQRDDEEACFWFSIAASSASSDEIPFASWRDNVAAKLTPEQNVAVERRAMQWKPKKI